MRFDGEVKILRFGVDGGAVAGQTGGVDQNVKGGQGGQRRLGRGDVGDVEGQDLCLHPRRGHFIGQGLQFGRAAGAQRHLGPLFGQRHGRGRPDAGRRPGHQRAAAIEPERRGAGQGHSAASP